MFGNNNPLQSIQFLGLLNAAKTGNSAVDAAIAVLLPIVVSSSLGHIRKNDSLAHSLASVRCWFQGKNYTQTITHRSVQYCGTYTKSVDNESQNEYLVRAIKLYVHQKCHLDLDDADVDLSDVAKRKSDQNCDTSATSTKRLLGDCEIVKKPPRNTWVCTGLFDGAQVWMRMDDSVSEDNGSGGRGEQKMRTVTITLRSCKKTSMDELIRKALEWYEEQLAKLETFTRYFFEISSFSESNSKASRCPVYHNYVLTGEKTFKTIFSQPAKKLVKTVDDFRLKRGKYGVEGFPYKLGILLHGEPGTGKTSMIKALAQYLGRHVVNISLSKIERNQDLRDIFFNRDGFQRNLSFKDLIFVLEDVDAASKVVTTRQKEVKVGTNTGESETKGPMSTDALSLAGILNVFDGVVATPGRVRQNITFFVGTSNALSQSS